MQSPAPAPDFGPLVAFLARIPSVLTSASATSGIGTGADQWRWWVKFAIDVDHALAWNAVQELAYVLNSLSVEEPLPTRFFPTSPPPYMNGGPRDFLSWVIDCPIEAMTPAKVTQWLEARLPSPVDDLDQWLGDD